MSKFHRSGGGRGEGRCRYEVNGEVGLITYENLT